MNNTTVIFLSDGMADEPLEALNHRTPLQCANTPAMDSIARNGRSGTLFTLPEPFPSSSEVANMSILGCDLESEYCGRGPLEALGKGIEITNSDQIFRLNIITQDKGILTDFSGGDITQNEANHIISKLNDEFGSEQASFHTLLGYRNILKLSGSFYSHSVKTEKPDDNQGNPIDAHLPYSDNHLAQETVEFLISLMKNSAETIRNCNVSANGVWPWGGGSIKPFRSLKEKYEISAAVIADVDVIKGLGHCIGMDVLAAPYPNHYTQPNYSSKTELALDAIQKYDFVYIHDGTTDEASHQRQLETKIKAIEDFDSYIVSPIIKALPAEANTAVLPDHATSVLSGRHTRVPVPVSVRTSNQNPDSVKVFDELSCRNGSLGTMSNDQLMQLLFRPERQITELSI